MPVTIQEIADKIGVNKATVSRILNNKSTGVKFSTKTKDRVFQAARELNYRPNPFAQSIKTGKTNIIGIATGSTTFMGLVSPYVHRTLIGITNFFNKTDYKYLVHHYDEDIENNQSVQLVQSKLVDGLIFILLTESLKSFLTNQKPVLDKLGIPYTIVHSFNQDYGCSAVGYDCRAAGEMATAHLIGHGYDPIGYVNQARGGYMDQELYNGYGQAHKNAGKAISNDLVFTAEGSSVEDGFALARKMMDSGGQLPRALFVGSDILAYGMIKAFTQAGLRIPEDIALVGFDDNDSQTNSIMDLTSVRNPALIKGEKAGELLFNQLDDKTNTAHPALTVVKPFIVEKRSCGCR